VGPNYLRELFESKHLGKSSKTAAPTGTWACWEWELRGTSNGLALWMNDQPVNDLTVAPPLTWPAPSEARLRFGSSSAPDSFGPEGHDLWYDEIAIANERIGCDR
jgi:hypothetical protein